MARIFKKFAANLFPARLRRKRKVERFGDTRPLIARPSDEVDVKLSSDFPVGEPAGRSASPTHSIDPEARRQIYRIFGVSEKKYRRSERRKKAASAPKQTTPTFAFRRWSKKVISRLRPHKRQHIESPTRWPGYDGVVDQEHTLLDNQEGRVLASSESEYHDTIARLATTPARGRRWNRHRDLTTRKENTPHSSINSSTESHIPCQSKPYSTPIDTDDTRSSKQNHARDFSAITDKRKKGDIATGATKHPVDTGVMKYTGDNHASLHIAGPGTSLGHSYPPAVGLSSNEVREPLDQDPNCSSLSTLSGMVSQPLDQSTPRPRLQSSLPALMTPCTAGQISADQQIANVPEGGPTLLSFDEQQRTIILPDLSNFCESNGGSSASAVASRALLPSRNGNGQKSDTSLQMPVLKAHLRGGSQSEGYRNPNSGVHLDACRVASKTSIGQTPRGPPRDNRSGSVIPSSNAPGNEDATSLWERALRTHAFGLTQGDHVSTHSKSTRRSLSPNIDAVRVQNYARSRPSLAMPTFSSAGHQCGDPCSLHHEQYQGESPTASRTDTSRQHLESWSRTIRRRCSYPVWSQFPSHTREERAGAAGSDDGVSVFDFAKLYQSISSKLVLPMTIEERGPIDVRGSLWRRLFLKFRMYTSDWHRYDRGFRSSIAVGGVLSHPELEVLPLTDAVLRPNLEANRVTHCQPRRGHDASLFAGFQFGSPSSSMSHAPEGESHTKQPSPVEDEYVPPLDEGLGPLHKPSVSHSFLSPDDARIHCRSVSISSGSSIRSFRTAHGSADDAGHIDMPDMMDCDSSQE